MANRENEADTSARLNTLAMNINTVNRRTHLHYDDRRRIMQRRVVKANEKYLEDMKAKGKPHQKKDLLFQTTWWDEAGKDLFQLNLIKKHMKLLA